jgi:hypothetical protein
VNTEWLKAAIREGANRTNFVSNLDRKTKRRSFGSTISVRNWSMLRQSGDYSDTTFAFYNMKTGRKIPLRNKIPELPRTVNNINSKQRGAFKLYESNGWYTFGSLTDAYNIDMGTYNEKLARGQIKFELERNEIMIAFTGSWNAKWATIQVPDDSPMFSFHKTESKYNEVTYAHYIGLSMFDKLQRKGSYPITNAWKSILGAWSKTNNTLEYLIDKQFISFERNPKMPSITGRGVAMLENLNEDSIYDLKYIGRYSDYVKRLEGKGIDLDDNVKMRGDDE